MNIPAPDTLWRHKKKGDVYRVIKETLAKQGYGEWTPSINYARADGTPGDYTRDTEWFLMNFEPVEQ